MLSAMHHRNRLWNTTTHFIKDVYEQRLKYHVRNHHVDILLYLLRERTEFRVAWKMAMAIHDAYGRPLDWITDELLDTLMITLGSFYDLNKAGANDESVMPPSWWRRGQRDDGAMAAWRSQCQANATNVLDAVVVHLYDKRMRLCSQPMLRMHPIGLRLWIDSINVEGSLMSVMLGRDGFTESITVSETSAVGNYIKHRDAASLRVLFESPVLTSQPWFNDMGLDAFDVCCERGWYEGAQLCFDVFVDHRETFIDRVLLHVLRFPDAKYATLAGFLHHRRDEFAACFCGSSQRKRTAIECAAVFCLHAGDVDGVMQCWREMVLVCDEINMARGCVMDGILTIWIRECIQRASKNNASSEEAAVTFTANQLACLEALFSIDDAAFGSTDGQELIYELHKVRLVNGDCIHMVGFMQSILKHQKETLLRYLYRWRNRLRDNVDYALFSPKHLLNFAKLVAAAPHSMRAFFLERFRAVKIAHGDAGKEGIVRFAISDVALNLAMHLPYEQAAFMLSVLEVEHGRANVDTFLRVSQISLFDIADDVILLLRNTYGADTMRHMATTEQYALSMPQMRLLFGDDGAAEMWRAMHAGGFSGDLQTWWLRHEAADLALLKACVGDRLVAMMQALSNDNIKLAFYAAFLGTPHNCDSLDFVLSLLSDAQRACLRESGEHVDDLAVDAMDVEDDQRLCMAVWLKQNFNIDDDAIADLIRGPECALGEMAFSVDGIAHFEALLDVIDTSSMPMAIFHQERDTYFSYELARAMLVRGTPRQKYTALFLLIHAGLPTDSRALFRQLATHPDVYPLLCEQRIHLHNHDDDITTLLEYVVDRISEPPPFARPAVTTMGVLLSLPCLRQQSVALAANPRRRTTLARQIAEMDTSRESSMRQFSPKERAVLDHMRDIYGDAVTTRGVPAILADLQRALREAYDAEPAEYRGRPLPFSHEMLLHMCREWAAEAAEEEDGTDSSATMIPKADVMLAHAKAAYHGNVWHTAARWFMKPNPWMHPRAAWVEVDPADPARRWAAGMESDKIRYLVAMYWLAATDTATSMLDNASVRDNVALFARTLALINRGHNYDSATRTRKLPGGQTVCDAIDDGEGDRPSCSMGLEQRFFTSVPANPHAHYNDVEERLTGAIVARLLAKVRALPESDRAALVDAASTYVIEQAIDAERAYLLMTHNLSDEEQAAVATEAGASAAYAAPFFATTDDCLHSHVLQYIPTFYYNAAV